MPDLSWPLVERAVVAALQGLGATVLTEEPPGLLDMLPALVVTVTGGVESGETSHDVQVDIDCDTPISAPRSDLWRLAQAVETRMDQLKATLAGGVFFDDVEARQLFAWLPHPNLDLRRVNGLFSLTVRPQ